MRRKLRGTVARSRPGKGILYCRPRESGDPVPNESPRLLDRPLSRTMTGWDIKGLCGRRFSGPISKHSCLCALVPLGRESSPVFFVRRRVRRFTPVAGAASCSPRTNPREWSAGRRVRRQLRALGEESAAPPGAPPALARNWQASTGSFCGSRARPEGVALNPRSALPGTRARRRLAASPCPSPASSSQTGPNAGRAGPGAARGRACEARARGPHHPARVAPHRLRADAAHCRRHAVPNDPAFTTPHDSALGRSVSGI